MIRRNGVISINEARLRRVQTAARRRRARVILLQLKVVDAAGGLHRVIGVRDTLKLAGVAEVIKTCFGFDSASPQSFYRCGEQVSMNDCLHAHVAAIRAGQLEYDWGLWRVRLSILGTSSRESSTPEALCLGGSGNLYEPDAPVDTARINMAIGGLSHANEEVVAIIQRTQETGLIPLLQALGLEDEPHHAMPGLHTLPVEQSRQARDAWWSCVIGMACLGGEDLGLRVARQLMRKLGWGENLTDERIRELCGASISKLEALGGCGAHALSAVERIDIYRELLRKR
ncbi:hypothetical protein AFK49_009220 [Corynebacterium ulcerans]|nr:hypothetical protein [Corynebacterium ulcerans]OAG70940.1 hypothetical protein AFK49_009220 [Corynebacterium ulcerans]